MIQNDVIMLESVLENCNRVNSRLVVIRLITACCINTGVFWNIYSTVGSSCSRYQI